MYSNKGCCGKIWLLLSTIITQALILTMIFGYFKYFVSIVPRREAKILVIIVAGFFSIVFELNYLFTTFLNPGTIDPIWSNENLKNVAFKDDYDKERFINLYPNLEIPRNEGKYYYCFECRIIKPERAHHCSTCNKCYLKMEHHCPLVGNCLGLYNHKYFIKSLIFGTMLGILIIFTWTKDIFNTNIEGKEEDTDKSIFERSIRIVSYMCSVIIFFACLIMLIDQSYLASHNMTSVEYTIYATNVYFSLMIRETLMIMVVVQRI